MPCPRCWPRPRAGRRGIRRRILWKLWRHGEDRRDTGHWLILDGDGKRRVVRTRPDPKAVPNAWVFPLTDREHVPGATIVAWFGLGFVLFLGAPVPEGGATSAYAAAVGWTATPIGSEIPAHQALAAGLALFLLQAFGEFDD